MSSSNNSNSNQPVVPSAREALNKFKMEAAQEVGVNLKQGYNGDLTSREAGSVGGQMVKKMIQAYENSMQNPVGPERLKKTDAGRSNFLRPASACRKSQRHQETFRCRLTHARGTHRSPPRPGFP